jgi:hypothetical protein
VIEALRAARPPEKRLSRTEFRAIVRDQAQLLRMDAVRAIETLPALLPEDAALRAQAFAALRAVVLAQGALSAEGQARLDRLAGIFGVAPPALEAPATEPPPALAAPRARKPAAARRPRGRA